jgi:hypothetical protein
VGDLSGAGVLRFAQDDTSSRGKYNGNYKNKSKSNSNGNAKVNYPTLAKARLGWGTLKFRGWTGRFEED